MPQWKRSTRRERVLEKKKRRLKGDTGERKRPRQKWKRVNTKREKTNSHCREWALIINYWKECAGLRFGGWGGEFDWLKCEGEANDPGKSDGAAGINSNTC